MYNFDMTLPNIRNSAIVVLLILSVIACQEPTVTVSPGNTNITYSAPIPQVAKFDGSLHVTIPKALDLNDFGPQNLSQNNIGPGMVFSRLLKLSADPLVSKPHMELECDLCASWEYTSDYNLNFKIKSNVYWHNGEQLTSQHLQNHYQKQLQNTDSYTVLTGIDSIITQSDTDIGFELKNQDPDLLFKLAHSENKILNDELLSLGNKSNASVAKLIGTGPWMHIPNDSDQDTITLIRNPVYFSHEKPLSQSITINNVENLTHTKILALIKSGQSNVILNNTNVPLQSDSKEFLKTQSILSYGGPSFFFNMSKQSMKSLVTRQNIFKSLDPWKHNIESNISPSIVSIGVPTVNKNYSDNQTEIRQKYFDDSVSRDLAPYQDTEKQILKIGVSETSAVYRPVFDNILQDLASSIYLVQAQSLSHDSYVLELSSKSSDFDILLGLIPPEEFINTFLLSTIHSSGEFSFSNPSDSVLNLMIENQVKEHHPVVRKSEIGNIQDHILENAYMYNSASLRHEWIHDQSIRNFFPNDNLGEYLYWADVWIE